jgi:Fe-S-cluster containining protein
MSELPSIPCDSCKAICCGPVPVTKKELIEIKKGIKRNPEKYKELMKQQQYFGNCIFLNLDTYKCEIYSFRPSICKAYGNYKNLPCIRKPEAASKEYLVVKDDPAGILSVDFTWKDFM